MGTARGAAGFDDAVRAEMERLARPRLYPEVPPRRYMSFYPMSKRRGEQVNWFDLGPRSAPSSCAATARSAASTPAR